MKPLDWSKDLPFAITVSDGNGTIVYMNEKSKKTFASSGGGSLVGQSLYSCHPDAANEKIKTLMQEQRANVYTIEKNGIKKMIYQSPWFENEQFAGLIELSLELPADIPHFVRKPQ